MQRTAPACRAGVTCEVGIAPFISDNSVPRIKMLRSRQQPSLSRLSIQKKQPANVCSEHMDVTQARVLGSIPDFSRILSSRPPHCPLLSSREISKGWGGMVGEQQPRKGRKDWLETLTPRMRSTESGGDLQQKTLPHQEGICTWSLGSCADTAFLTWKIPPWGKDPIQLYESSSLTPACNWGASFETVSNTNILFIAQMEYEENHYFSVLFLRPSLVLLWFLKCLTLQEGEQELSVLPLGYESVWVGTG